MADLHGTSIDVLRRGQAPSGAFVAAPDYPPYRYAWIRDGTFCAHALDAVGERDSAEAFHRFVAGTVERHRGKVEALQGQPELTPGEPPEELVLHTRYTLEGEESGEPWSNFQLDGYGFWLSGLARHLRATGADPSPFLPAVGLVASYLSRLWEHPCWSCWEEHPDRRHSTTLAAVAAGLRAGAGLLDDPALAETAERARETVESWTTVGALAKSEHSTEVDASALFVLGAFGPFSPDGEIGTTTLERVETDLVTVGHGPHRYIGDTFYGGGQWVPLAGALAIVRADLGRREDAEAAVEWIEGTTGEDGRLPEQVAGRLLYPQMEQVWVDKWGPVARPLLWSHAMYLLAHSALA